MTIAVPMIYSIWNFAGRQEIPKAMETDKGTIKADMQVSFPVNRAYRMSDMPSSARNLPTDNASLWVVMKYASQVFVGKTLKSIHAGTLSMSMVSSTSMR